MSPIRKLLLVGAGILALHGVQACASETGADLNPQPLPPDNGDPVFSPGPDKGGGEGTSGNGPSDAPPMSGDAAADSGADADGGNSGNDASDAGTD